MLQKIRLKLGDLVRDTAKLRRAIKILPLPKRVHLSKIVREQHQCIERSDLLVSNEQSMQPSILEVEGR